METFSFDLVVEELSDVRVDHGPLAISFRLMDFQPVEIPVDQLRVEERSKRARPRSKLRGKACQFSMDSESLGGRLQSYPLSVVLFDTSVSKRPKILGRCTLERMTDNRSWNITTLELKNMGIIIAKLGIRWRLLVVNETIDDETDITVDASTHRPAPSGTSEEMHNVELSLPNISCPPAMFYCAEPVLQTPHADQPLESTVPTGVSHSIDAALHWATVAYPDSTPTTKVKEAEPELEDVKLRTLPLLTALLTEISSLSQRRTDSESRNITSVSKCTQTELKSPIPDSVQQLVKNKKNFVRKCCIDRTNFEHGCDRAEVQTKRAKSKPLHHVTRHSTPLKSMTAPEKAHTYCETTSKKIHTMQEAGGDYRTSGDVSHQKQSSQTTKKETLSEMKKGKDLKLEIFMPQVDFC